MPAWWEPGAAVLEKCVGEGKSPGRLDYGENVGGSAGNAGMRDCGLRERAGDKHT